MPAEIHELLTRPIDRICSSYGCVIEGSALVTTVLQNTIAALQALSQTARVGRMDKLVRDRIANAVNVAR